jgi:hypothetical protein
MTWSHNGTWLISGDHKGIAHYYRKNLRVLEEFKLHDEPIRGLRSVCTVLCPCLGWLYVFFKLHCLATCVATQATQCACVGPPNVPVWGESLVF